MPETDQEPQRHTGYLIRRAQQAHVARWTREVSTEISSVQYAILTVLDRRGQASQRELCDEADLDRSTIADLVRRMEARGLIARRRDPDDSRRNTVTLTDHGLAERRRLAPLVAAADARLTQGLSADQREAVREGLRALLDAQS